MRDANVRRFRNHGVSLDTRYTGISNTLDAGEVAGETDEHFAQGRVDIEVKLALEVVRTEFAETVRSLLEICP